MTLDEILLANTPAAFEPALDYVVTKFPRFPFDKFPDADHTLGMQMKATGEVMSIGRTFKESFLKAVRSLETGASHLYMPEFDSLDRDELLAYICDGKDDRPFAIARLLRLGVSADEIYSASGIDRFFLYQLQEIINEESKLSSAVGDTDELITARAWAFQIRRCRPVGFCARRRYFSLRERHGVFRSQMIDTCARVRRCAVLIFHL